MNTNDRFPTALLLMGSMGAEIVVVANKGLSLCVYNHGQIVRQ